MNEAVAYGLLEAVCFNEAVAYVSFIEAVAYVSFDDAVAYLRLCASMRRWYTGLLDGVCQQ